MTINPEDQVIYRPELCKLLKVCSETMRIWIRDKRLPKPDVAMTQRRVGWKVSTLRKAGIGVV